MQDPKETFNNIEHNTEMALLQSEKIAESVDNLEPIMEGVLVKADDILNEQKKTNELLSKEEEPKPEVQKIELLGAELITIKGKDGENGDKGEKGDKGDTGERGEKGEQGERGDIGKQGEKGEKGDKGDTGKDGIDGLDGKDGKNGKNGKDGSQDTPEEIKSKLESLAEGLDYEKLSNLPDLEKIARLNSKQSSKTYGLSELEDVTISGDIPNNYALTWDSTLKRWTPKAGGGGGGGTWGSITGTLSDQIDLQSALNAKQDSIITGTSAQYLKGDLSLGTFPTNVSAFTNDSGYITSSALTGYVPTTRTLTINGTTLDLSADRTWSVGTVTDVAALTLGTTGTDLSSTVATGTTTPVITLNVPTASALNRGALSSTDWSTFNSKESALTFSTGLTRTTNTITADLSTGVSGGQSAIGGTASGDTLTLSSTTNATKGKILFGNSAYNEVNNRLGIGTTTPSSLLDVGTYSSSLYTIKTGGFVIQPHGMNSVSILDNSYHNGAGWTKILSGYSSGFQFYNGQLLVRNASSGSAGAFTPIIPLKTDFSNGGTVTLGGNVANALSSYTGAVMIVVGTGRVGIGNMSPSARLHLAAGTAVAGTAPLKFTSGTNLTTPEAGAVEYDGTELYFTPSTTRYKLGQVTAGSSTIASGTYTPTLTGVTNVTSTTAYVCQYMRVGNVVTVSGKIEVTPTVNNAQTTIGVSLPIASNFANSQECGGAAHSVANTVLGHGAAIYADATNDRAEMDYFETHGASDTFSFSFTYQII